MKYSPPKTASDRLMAILAITLAVTVMNATMFNIVLPEIRHEFALSMSEVSWVTTSYLLVFAVGSVIYGKLADTCRIRSLITFGFITFAAGSVVGMLAGSFGMLIAGRIVQAAGAAVIPAISGIIPVRYIPPASRGRALGITMTGGAVGSAAGPALAAMLSGAVHWRLLFLMPVLTLLLLPLYYKFLLDERTGKARLDWLGGGLLTGTIAMLLLYVTNAAIWMFLSFVLLLSILVWRIRRHEAPFIRPDLFRNKRYVAALCIGFMTTGIGYSLAFLTPTLLTEVQRLSAGSSGWVLAPAAVFAAILSKYGGNAADRKGNKFLYNLAALLYVCCFTLMSSFTAGSPFILAIILIFGNVGQVYMAISLTKTVSITLPKDQSGVGMGLMSMLNFVAGAVFASLYGRLVDHGSRIALNPFVKNNGSEVFSNIYFLLSLLVIAVTVVYALAFREQYDKKKNDLIPEVQDLQKRSE